MPNYYTVTRNSSTQAEEHTLVTAPVRGTICYVDHPARPDDSGYYTVSPRDLKGRHGTRNYGLSPVSKGQAFDMLGLGLLSDPRGDCDQA